MAVFLVCLHQVTYLSGFTDCGNTDSRLLVRKAVWGGMWGMMSDPGLWGLMMRGCEDTAL